MAYMKIEKNLNYNKRLVITAERMEKLHSLVGVYCQNIEYKAKLKNAAEVSFDTFEELMNYDNVGNKKIITLKIHGGSKSEYRGENIDYNPKQDAKTDIYINIENTHNTSRIGVFYCNMSFENPDNQRLFEDDLNQFLQNFTEGQISFVIWRYIVMVLSVIAIGYGYNALHESNFNWSGVLIIAVLAIIVYVVIIKIIDRCLYRSVEFAWGEELKKHEKRADWRSKWIWCILIPIVIALVIPFVIPIIQKIVG